MAVDHAGGGADATIETVEEPPAAEQPPPPDRPGAEGVPSRAESRHAAVSEQANDQPIEDKPVEEEPKGSTPPRESSAEQNSEAAQEAGEPSEPSDSPTDRTCEQASPSTSETIVEQPPSVGVEDDEIEQPLGPTDTGTAEESGDTGSATEADGYPVPEQSEDHATEGQPAQVDAETPGHDQDPQRAPSAEDEVPADTDAVGRRDDVESEDLPQTHDEDTTSDQKPSYDPRDAARAAVGEDDETVVPAEVPEPVREEDVREEAVQEAERDGQHTDPRETREDASGSEANRGSTAQGGGEVFGSSGSVENEARLDQADRPDAAVDRPLYPEVTDRADYVFTDREYAFAEVSPEQAWNMHEQRAPLGVPPEQWDSCVAELREALAADGITDADVRVQGSGAQFCSENPKKWFPQTEDELRDAVSEHYRNAPEEERVRRMETAAARYREAGFAEDDPKPAAPFFDSMYKLDVTDEMSDYDFQIASDTLAERFGRLETSAPETQWRSQVGGHFKHRHLKQVAPGLHAWAERWEGSLGREVTLATFDRHGPSTGLDDGDWRLIEPEEDSR